MATSESLYSIECSDQPFDLSFHPEKESLVAAALIDGTLEVHDFSSIISSSGGENDDDDDDSLENETILSSTPVHTQIIPSHGSGENTKLKKASARAVRFSTATNGTRLFTGGSGGDLCCIDSEVVSTFSTNTNGASKSVLWRVQSASYGRQPIQVLHELPPEFPGGPLLVTGDEGGGVRLWDVRLCGGSDDSSNNNDHLKRMGIPQGCVYSFRESKDYISGFEHSPDGNMLLATSADGTLSVFDLRMAKKISSTEPLPQKQQQQKAIRQSDDQEDELLSVAIMKNGKKVVCGTHEGVLAVFSWGTWGDVSDRFPGHPASIDALLKIDEDTLLTGSSDGLLRVVSIQPDKFLGCLGDHGGFPVEKLEFNCTKNFVGSVSHDAVIRLWDTRILREEEDFDEDDPNSDAKLRRNNVLSGKLAAPLAAVPPVQKVTGGSDDEWEDMDGDDDDEMDEDSDDDGENMSDDSDDDEDSDAETTTNDKRAQRLKTENEKFFEDL